VSKGKHFQCFLAYLADVHYIEGSFRVSFTSLLGCAFASQSVNLGSIPSSSQTKRLKVGIHSFPT